MPRLNSAGVLFVNSGPLRLQDRFLAVILGTRHLCKKYPVAHRLLSAFLCLYSVDLYLCLTLEIIGALGVARRRFPQSISFLVRVWVVMSRTKSGTSVERNDGPS